MQLQKRNPGEVRVVVYLIGSPLYLSLSASESVAILWVPTTPYESRVEKRVIVKRNNCIVWPQFPCQPVVTCFMFLIPVEESQNIEGEIQKIVYLFPIAWYRLLARPFPINLHSFPKQLMTLGHPKV